MSRLTLKQLDLVALNGGFLFNEDRAVAVAVAMAESGGDPLATHKNTNGSTDYGLWQINSIHTATLRGGDWKNPTDNARMAYAVYLAAGRKFTPWTTYTSGRYLAFLSVARRNALHEGTESSMLPASNSVQGSATTGAVPSGLSVPSVSPLAGLVDLAKLLTSPAMWLRAGMMLAGVLLLWWGLRSATTLDNKAAGAALKYGMAAVTDGASLAASKATKAVAK